MKKALLIYYTFTGEARRAIDVAKADLTTAGFDVSLARVDFADPAKRLRRPVAPKDLKIWCDAAENGTPYPVVVEPASALSEQYDLVCIFTNTWQHHPCVPIRSLLNLPEIKPVLNGKPFAVYVICRRLWEKNLEIVRKQAEQHGGRFVAGEHFDHHGGNVGSLIRTITYALTSGDKVARLLGMRLPIPEYGLSDEAMKRVSSFTREVARAA
jgi:hypothetical protein